jgi:photosystem II stability/assembly factor-like uncharacterized protein
MKLTRTSILVLACLGSGLNAQSPTWKTLPNAPIASFRHENVHFYNGSTGWIVNSNGKIFKTTSAGEMWKVQVAIDTALLRSVAFLDSLVGWAGTLSSPRVLYSTTDGGLSWGSVGSIQGEVGNGICGMCPASDSVVYGVGVYNGPARVFKTTDRGNSWTAFDMSSLASGLVDCYFFNPDSGIAVGGIGAFPSQSRALVLFTSDGGVSWETRFEGQVVDRSICWKISFPTQNVGYVSVEGPSPSYFLKTTNGGMDWKRMGFVDNYYEQGIGFANDSVRWIGGDAITYETLDGGETWHEADIGVNINRFFMLSDTLGYAVGKSVYKYSIDTSQTDIGENKPVPKRFAILQNYPNPFNPSTTIRYELAEQAFVTLNVYNLLGQRVAALVDEEKEAGSYQVQFDGTSDASGVYFYRMRAGGFVETKRLVLLK